MRIFSLLLLICTILFPITAGAVSEQYRFMLDENPQIISPGSYDATVRWGGREITVSQLKEEFGPAATRRLWNKLDRDNRFKLLKGYEGWFGQPAYLDQHFGQDVRGEIVNFYASNTVIAKLKEQAGSQRVREMLSENIKQARTGTLGSSSYYGGGTSESCKAAEKLLEKIRTDRGDLEKLISMASRLEAQKIGIALFEASKFGAEQLVGFVTGNIYSASSKVSDLVAEIINQAKSRFESALDSEPSAADVIRLKNDLQRIYLQGAENLAGRILENREKLEELQKQCKEEEEQKEQEKREEADRQIEEETSAAERVNSSPVSVSASYDRNDTPEQRERKLAAAALEKLRQIDREYYEARNRAGNTLYGLGRELHYNEEKTTLYREHSFSITMNYYWEPYRIKAYYLRGYRGETVRPYETPSSLRDYAEQAERDMSAVAGYQGYNSSLLSRLENAKEEAITTLTGIEGRRRGLISGYGGLIRKYYHFTPSHNDIAQLTSIRRAAEDITRATLLDEELSAALELMEQSIDVTREQAGELQSLYRELQNQYTTLADNLYLAIGKIAEEKARYKTLLEGIGVTSDPAGDNGWRYSIRYRIQNALSENYLNEIRELMTAKDFQAAGAKMEELFRKTDAINDQAMLVKRLLPYAQAAEQEISTFLSSIYRLVSSINREIDQGELGLNSQKLEYAYSLVRRYTGGAWSLQYYIHDVETISIDSYYEGAIIVKAVDEYNRRLKDYLRGKKTEMQRARAKAAAIITPAIWKNQEAFQAARREADRALWAAMPDNWLLLKEFADATPGYTRWLPTMRAYYNGRRLPDIDSEENRELLQSIRELRQSAYEDVIRQAAEEREQRIAGQGISITSILVDGEPYEYPVTVVEDATGGRVILSGTIRSGVVPDRLAVTVGGGELNAALGEAQVTPEAVTTGFRLEIPVPADDDVTVALMAYQNRRGRGTSFTVRTFDRRAVTARVREFYDTFRRRYGNADLLGVLECVTGEWRAAGGRDKLDLELRLQEIFDTFDSLDVDLTGLTIRPGQDEFYAVANYRIRIQGELWDDPDIRHYEEGEVTDYLVKKGDKLYIARTVGRGFF